MISPTKTLSARSSNAAWVSSRDRLPRATGSRARPKWSAFCANSSRVSFNDEIRTPRKSCCLLFAIRASTFLRHSSFELRHSSSFLSPFEHHAIVFFQRRARAELLAKRVQKIAKPTRIGSRRTVQAEAPHLRRNQSH